MAPEQEISPYILAEDLAEARTLLAMFIPEKPSLAVGEGTPIEHHIRTTARHVRRAHAFLKRTGRKAP